MQQFEHVTAAAKFLLPTDAFLYWQHT